ncbi:MAG: TetR/AcrR family transcriptional regulator [Oscillibacter sp.]|jgi:AcrR family transcriptional regulator|nr:TetR/AcrR family transcriptional regulator [Oscillibacter sp.]
MLSHSDDRRARRSRRLLKEGLSELLQERQFSQISVRDITNRMDLNRGTFYLHYSDTYDLLQDLENDVLRDIQEMIDAHRGETNGGSLRPIFEPLLRYVEEHHTLCEALFLNNANSNFLDRVQGLIRDNGGAIIRGRWPDATDEQAAYLMGFLAFGLIGLIKMWFDLDRKTPESELLDRMDRLSAHAAQILMA